MVKRSFPVTDLLSNNSRPVDVMGSASDLLRNIPNLARIGGPQVPLVAPLGGRPMESAMIQFLGYLSSHYHTSIADRRKAKPGSIPPRRPGQRFDVDAWLRSSAIMLKVAQAELSCHGRNKIALVNRYLEQPGRWKDPQGLNVETLKEWRKRGPLLRREVWTKTRAGLLISMFLPPGFEILDIKSQRAHLSGLKPFAEDFFTPRLGDAFPVEFFSFFLDFSQHSDKDIQRLATSLKSQTGASQQERFERLAYILAPAIESLADLIADEGSTFTFKVMTPSA